MEIVLNEVDSQALRRPVLELLNVGKDDDIATAEKDYVARFHPAYVVCKVPVESPALIHRLEEAGFHFIETQLRLTFSRRQPFDVPDGPYVFERVVDERGLEEVLVIVRKTFDDDRWLVDPWFGGAQHLSGSRYEAYVRLSFQRPDEGVYRLLERQSGKTLAMITHRLLGNGDAVMLLAGLHPDYKGAGSSLAMLLIQEYNELVRQGVRRLTTHVSARNYAILNSAMRARFRLVQTSIVLRKVYEAVPEHA